MLIFRTNKKFFKIIIILQIFSTLFTSSCMLKQNNQNDNLRFKKAISQLEELTVPNDTNIPVKNEEYNIPYKDIEENNYNILPPI
ncbi:hypothetical protein [Buchnera aphidicola]|uniref:Lipoprotein n=2 Tax=Buchnera aphidicola TaxID=9 RepID=A0A6C1FB87_BUCUN|nr:hypothetical protein [Buchnera aphidicola]QIE01850.1 hypothetical protein GUU85_00455 [Buchnera aphidicola (Uroleucon sonchi)]